MTDEDEFFAWLDGELDSEAAAKVAARVAADPALGEQARAHRALGEQLRGAFEPLMAAPVPDRLAAPPIDFAAARERSATRRPVGGLPQWAAMAATLVLGLGLGTMVGGRGGQDAVVAIDGGHMVAASTLGHALDTQLASNQQDAATRIGLSFRDRNGALCRSFEGTTASGLACRDDGQWRIEGLYGATGDRAAGDYRMAAGGDPRLTSLIEETIAGEPLDAVAERAAQERGWR